jgi:ParB family chromosome partitioning protein
MNEIEIELVPVARICIVNPRDRNRVAWLAIVASIRSVGLKKPIMVSRREAADSDGNLFDLVCGQGRLEAFKELAEEYIPAIITEASRPDQYLMSLVENIARRAASNKSLFFEIRNLLERGYDGPAIAAKLGLNRNYVAGVVDLVAHGESKLIQEVESGKLPVSVAVAIANGNDEGIQRALADGYSSGEFRGSKLKAVRKLIKQRAGKEGPESPSSSDKSLTGPALVKIYRERIGEQQRLVARAEGVKERLLIIASAMRTLLADEDFRTVLQAEGLLDMPEQLRLRMG